MKITNLKAGVKNPNRVNVYIDGKYSLSLTVTQVVDFKVKIGVELTDDELEELQRASAYGKLYQRTLEWVLTRPHSVRETRDYLRRKKNLLPEDIEQLISSFLDRGYLNDEVFVKFYVENRFINKGISHRRLELELLQKGIDKDIIANIFSSNPRDEATEIRKTIAKKIRQPKFAADPQRLINYLIRQGYDFQLSRTLVHEMDLQSSERNWDF